MKYAHAEDRFECQFCDSSYASKVSLKYHEQTKHVKAAPVECQLCLEIFATDVTLKNHIKVVHGTNSAYSCDYCDAKFNQKKNLQVHLNNIHGKDFRKETSLSEKIEFSGTSVIQITIARRISDFMKEQPIT